MGIPENTVQDTSYDCVYETIESEAQKNGLSDMDVWIAWKIGIAVFTKTKELGAKFPHDVA